MMQRSALGGCAENALLTMLGYVIAKMFHLINAIHFSVLGVVRALSTMLAIGALAGAAQAQTTLTADWTNLGNSNLQVVNDGTTLAVGPNSITINTSAVTDGDANDGDFTNFYSTGMLSYYTGQVSSFTGNLLYNTDHSVFDAGDYFETTYTFATAVEQLAFTVGNVDRFFGSVNFHDAVVIEYDTGSGTWQNLRSLGAFTLGSAVGLTTVNGQQGFHGTNYSGGITSTTGDIQVDFGTVTVERVRIRYLYGQASPGSDPSGDWQYMAVSDFTWEQTFSFADLSLSKTVNNSTPANGAGVTYTLQVFNAASSALTANGVQVTDLLPAGVDYVSDTGSGSYNPVTGVWTVGTLAPGASASLDITVTVTATAGAVIDNVAEITASSVADVDSSPGNAVPAEDDYDTATFTVAGSRVAGTPPLLNCSAGSAVHDWDPLSWTAGSTANSYALSTLGQVAFTLTNPGVWLNNAALGGQSPNLQTDMTGGIGTPEESLIQLVDLANQSQVVTTQIDLPRSVMAAQFTVFDVDFGTNQFADRITVTGSFNGNTVIPTLTNGVANYVAGNTAYGDAASDSTSANGNVTVTFQQPVDTITIQYGNHSLAPANPGQQAVALHDITVCRPTTTLAATKVSAVFSDPVNGSSDPKAIPGAMIDYVIGVANTGIVEADDGSVSIVDTVPADTKMCLADISPGSGPVLFVDGSPVSGLSYSYTALGSGTDDLEFSNNGGTSYGYTPVADADGCDTNITNFRVSPSGELEEGTSFSLRARFMIE
ncbi:DUF11 domain-containing protein [Parerythrobacter jejuensis]|uniref:DUF11 domain-containing protein n=1 Tax=Parerythrobacter jejuensis TaxID=795812 RepID=A0A845AMZ6_9SPHN|nr:DUF11 domain-containing protein [Parerythrobacter jejuensis]MXP32182.1 DUF11 domain-containing protein [Parerythrobacter jejuensis]